MTLKELLAKLALHQAKLAAAKSNLGTGETAEEKKTQVAELNAVCDEIEALNKEIAEKKAEELALSRSGALAAVAPAQTAETGELTASDIHVGQDNILLDDTRGFDNLADLAASAYNASMGIGSYDERLDVLSAGLRQESGPQGGFLVPPAFSTQIFDGAQQMSLDLYGMTDNFNLGQSESITLPAIDESSRANGSRWGGTFARWAEEEAKMTESEPKFRNLTLRPKELHVFTKVSDKLLMNSPIALEQFIGRAASDEIIFRTSDAVLNGDGVGKPKGIMKSAALVVVPKLGGQANFTIKFENINTIYSLMPAKFRAGAVWLINGGVLPELENMALGNQPIYLPPGGMADAPLGRLKGRPVMETEYNEGLGTKGDIVFVNLRAYATAQRGGVRSASSIHLDFDRNKTAFRWITEVDGQTWINKQLTEFKGGRKVSPYVTLADRK